MEGSTHPGALSGRRLAVAVVAISCGAVIAACGSSSASSTTEGGSAHAEFLAFSNCMRSHRVPGFPDPGATGGVHVSASASAGFNPKSPAFQTAMQACKHLLPGGGAPPESAAQKTAELKFAECMRAHGVPNYPDPTNSASSGLRPQTPLPSSINTSSPAFQKAQVACASTGGG